jgi:hypothetical protein
MNIAENISYNIYCLKTNLKLSYENLGVDLGIKGTKIKRIVDKTQSAKINEIEAIAKYFGINPIDLISKKL